MPGFRSTIRYWPVPSVTTVRDFSMSTGLDASTVTPGMTAPEASLTMPAIAGWENAGADKKRRKRMTADPVARARIEGLQSVRHDTPRDGDYAPSPLDGRDQVGMAGTLGQPKASALLAASAGVRLARYPQPFAPASPASRDCVSS